MSAGCSSTELETRRFWDTATLMASARNPHQSTGPFSQMAFKEQVLQMSRSSEGVSPCVTSEGHRKAPVIRAETAPSKVGGEV